MQDLNGGSNIDISRSHPEHWYISISRGSSIGSTSIAMNSAAPTFRIYDAERISEEAKPDLQ
eukprot:scaffold165702_cov38-Prasinocladus_malaysianus.AAC.2